MRPQTSVDEVVSDPAGVAVVLAGGERLVADAVVAGLGIVPATGLAAAAGLRVADGIVVDATGQPTMGAGCLRRRRRRPFPAALLGTDIRVEHEDNANSHGFAVGANMAGAGVPYRHLPFFYSDMFELGYEAVGGVDPRLRRPSSGSSRSARASSPTSIRSGGRAASCSGTSSARSTGRAR